MCVGTKAVTNKVVIHPFFQKIVIFEVPNPLLGLENYDFLKKGVYDHFVRNGFGPDAHIVSDMPKTTWVSDTQGIRCTQIVTSTQIISLDFNYDATCYFNEFYSPVPFLLEKC